MIEMEILIMNLECPAVYEQFRHDACQDILYARCWPSQAGALVWAPEQIKQAFMSSN